MKFSVKELQSRLQGEVFDSSDALDYFSTDGSVFAMRPKAIVYPRHTDDVRQTVAYLKELAAAGERISLTARGKGTDQAGGALGDGVMLVFPAHMKRLLRLDRDRVTVQPGLLYRDLQNTLHSHARFLPPYPSSIDFSTIGGAIANNACGEKTIKYGSTRDFVESLRVVLSDGSLVETRRLSPRELNRKKGQTDLEGEIYRRIDNLIGDHETLINHAAPQVTKNAAGYALWDVKRPDGSFDLSQLLIGSQGTLGVITDATLKTAVYNPRTTLIVAHFDSHEKAEQAVLKLLPLKPSALEVVDFHLLDWLKHNRPAQIAGLIPEQLPQITLLIEFDDLSQLRQTLKSGQATRIAKRLSYAYQVSSRPVEQEKLWSIRHSAAAVIWMNPSPKKALPIIEDGIVPVDKFSQFLKEVYKLLARHKVEIAVWGHAGNANFHMQPFLDLGKPADRKKVFAIMDDFYKLVIKLGGSTSAEHNDGMLRAPYLKDLYGKDMYQLFREINQIFDPQNILNPEKIIDRDRQQIEALLRHEYSMPHLYDHMPHN
jgi:FAD/FMN-containing dehydrogenase